jgi:UDP-N-acetylmuramyl pentapeptide phosphotransferase/UDP-N-acetylglucosamine-1-phosphate transferase
MNFTPIASTTPNSLFKGLALVVLCAFIAGISGILTALLMLWLTRQRIAQDSHEKHGISHQPASRLGGVAVAFCALCIYWISVGMHLPLEPLGDAFFSNLAIYALLIGVIGFCDDVFGHISAKGRILVTTLIFAACLIINPGYIPTNIGIPIIDSTLNIWPIAFVLCLVACVGMLNATNMADGANGLMPLVFMGTFYGFALITGELVYFALSIALLVFTFFNVLSGRLFLGDVGSYGLGAMAVLGAIKIMSETEAEVWLFLCLAAYPTIEFFVSVSRRKLAGRSPFSADSDHMHNRLYAYIRRFLKSPLAANSVSGLTIGLASTGVSVLLLSQWDTNADYWALLFAAQISVYLLACYLLPSNEVAASE